MLIYEPFVFYFPKDHMKKYRFLIKIEKKYEEYRVSRMTNFH